jgi:hypothetical protein
MSASTSHRDERQIQLDTERSFVLYPVGSCKIFNPTYIKYLHLDDVTTNKETLQHQLHELLLALFRKHPKLSYFQVRNIQPFCAIDFHFCIARDITTLLLSFS